MADAKTKVLRNRQKTPEIISSQGCIFLRTRNYAFFWALSFFFSKRLREALCQALCFAMRNSNHLRFIHFNTPVQVFGCFALLSTQSVSVNPW